MPYLGFSSWMMLRRLEENRNIRLSALNLRL